MNRMVKFVFLACLGMVFNFHFSIFNSIHAQSPLSDSATAYVLTCGPGNDFYTTFGHSAIRISDPTRGIDQVYNYGTFDFDTPHFYWKFMRGQLDYQLGRTTFGHFLAEYASEGRFVSQQRLHFDARQTANLYILLEQNYQPEYRYYRYDFFRDNCATRVRDMVEAANGKCKIEYGGDWKDHSYRYWLHQATAGGRLEWWMLGVDFLLGLSADHVCDISESMFYPMAMMWLYSDATRTGEGEANACAGKPLVAPTIEWLQDHRPPLKRSFPPLVVFGLLFAAVALLTWKKLWPHWADRLLFIIAGILGAIAVYIFVLITFFVDPFSFRWDAIYGKGVNPDGFEVRGIDISRYQDNIDWTRLRNANINGQPISFEIASPKPYPIDATKATIKSSIVNNFFIYTPVKLMI